MNFPCLRSSLVVQQQRAVGAADEIAEVGGLIASFRDPLRDGRLDGGAFPTMPAGLVNQGADAATVTLNGEVRGLSSAEPFRRAWRRPFGLKF